MRDVQSSKAKQRDEKTSCVMTQVSALENNCLCDVAASHSWRRSPSCRSGRQQGSRVALSMTFALKEKRIPFEIQGRGYACMSEYGALAPQFDRHKVILPSRFEAACFVLR